MSNMSLRKKKYTCNYIFKGTNKSNNKLHRNLKFEKRESNIKSNANSGSSNGKNVQHVMWCPSRWSIHSFCLRHYQEHVVVDLQQLEKSRDHM